MTPLVFERKAAPFSVIPSSLLESGNGDAVLIYGYLATKESSWVPRREDMMRVVGNSRARYEKGTKLLKLIGCLTVTARRDPDGVIRRAFAFDPMLADMAAGRIPPQEPPNPTGSGKSKQIVPDPDKPSNGAIVQESCNINNGAIVQESNTTTTPVIEIYADIGGCDPDEAAQDFDDPPLTDADVWGAPDISTLVENPCQPNLDEARHFLDAFGGAITFQTFDDTKQNPKLARILSGSLDEHAKTLADINAAGGGIYFAVNEQMGTGRNAESTKRVRALFADLDGAPLKPVRDFFLPPHIIVESSPGKFHAYWLVKNCPLAVFADMQKAIAKRFSSDPKVCDLPRVMRVPGFCHRKGEPFPTRMIEFNEMEPYQFQRLAKVFKPVKEEKPTFTGAVHSGDWTARGVVEGQRNNTLFRRACAARAKGKSYGQIMSELMADNAACNPPLPLPEIQIIARQAVKYGVAP